LGSYDNVAIIGGGMAGLRLAEKLAGSDIYVTLYEGKRDVSYLADRASGVLSVSGVNRLGIDYSGALKNVLDGAVIYSSRQQMKVVSEKPQAYVLDRKLLIKEAYANAKRAGANIVLGKRLDEAELNSLDDGKTVIVGADGPASSVAKAFGFTPIKEFLLTYKAVYENVNYPESSIVRLFFDNAISKGLFGWLIPYSNDRIELGLGVSEKTKGNSKQAFEKFVKNSNIHAIVDSRKASSEYASVIPIGARRVTVKGNVLLVGDAAGQTKATTGGGLIFGLSCADVALQSIVNAFKNGRPLSDYERSWRKLYGLDLNMHRRLQSYYSNLDNRSIDRALYLLKKLGFDSFLSKHGDMDSIKTMMKRAFIRK